MKVSYERFKKVKLFKLEAFNSPLGTFKVSYKNTISDIAFTQDSISIIKNIGTIKGLHFQEGKFSQSKFITVLQGEIIDVFVDIDPKSKTFLDHGQVRLSAKNNKAIYLPNNFAHGYITMSENTIISYKINGQYLPNYERTIIWNDESIGIKWPKLSNYHISDKDMKGERAKNLII